MTRAAWVGAAARSSVSRRRFRDFIDRWYSSVVVATWLVHGDRAAAQRAAEAASALTFAKWRTLGTDDERAKAWVMWRSIRLCWRMRFIHGLLGGASDSRRDAASGSRADLVDDLGQLPFRQRAILVLHLIGDIPVPLISDVTGLSERRIAKYLVWASRALEKRLGREHVRDS